MPIICTFRELKSISITLIICRHIFMHTMANMNAA